MTSEQLKHKSTFRYNVAFYYQSTIIYFVVFALYLIIRGEFIDNSYTLAVKDPILYFLAIVVIISILALLYNIYKKRFIEIDQSGIVFINRFKRREIPADRIESIKLTKERRTVQSKALQLVLIKLKSRRRRLIVRPTDYENFEELTKRFLELKFKIEGK